MDEILEIMDEALTRMQKGFHAYVVERKIRKMKKNVMKKIIYINDWLETKMS